MRVPGRTGNAWPPEQVSVEIISGNPNGTKVWVICAGRESLEVAQRADKEEHKSRWRLGLLGFRKRPGVWVTVSVCVKTLLCVHACAPWHAHTSRGVVGRDPWSGSPVTGAHLLFCKLSSDCAKQPPEDRISHCDLAPEVTELCLRGQTRNTHCHVSHIHSQVEGDTQWWKITWVKYST